MEMWGDHENGFPQPRGCFIKQDLTDTARCRDPTTGDARPQSCFEAYIVFNERNGLAQNTFYQLVMPVKFKAPTGDGATGGLTKDYPGDGVVHVWAMDDYIARPFERTNKSPSLGRAAPDRCLPLRRPSVPLAGAVDLLDLGFKANRRNARLLRQWLEAETRVPQQTGFTHPL